MYGEVHRAEPMKALCGMVVDTRYKDLPDEVIEHARRSIFDTIGVTIGGSSNEVIPRIVELVRDRGGKRESHIPFYGGMVPAAEAGLAIGPMSRALDFGDVHEEAGHSSEYTVPTLLAATGLCGEVTGREFVTAYVVGQEVLTRIGTAFRSISGAAVQQRGSGHFIFGAVAAAGKLIGLSLDELENAQGIARGMTQPHDAAMYALATDMVCVHHGLVCQAAINACLLAKKGITGPRHEVLLPPKGYLGFATWPIEPEALTRGLGEKWEMLNTTLKLHAACMCTHTTIDALLEQMRNHSFVARDIAAIDIDESPVNWEVVCKPTEAKWHPATPHECQFSLPYAVATAAHDGGVFLNSYTPGAMARQKVRDLMTKVSAREEKQLASFASRVHTVLKDGRHFSNERRQVKGHREDPLAEAELMDKFRRCAAYSAYQLATDVVDTLIKTLLRLEEVDDVVTAVILPLTPDLP